ncbi:hypothetical protein, partial [Herbaspirillum sp. alder98]|uniref:hypothetical protein n=1 Tax=Herbaspirillum sp. alder98 TaxID=2913096 RepID=UPI001CD87659
LSLPLNAHAYRLLIFKDLFCRTASLSLRLRRQQIVLFVSSREMRLCGFYRIASTTFFAFL